MDEYRSSVKENKQPPSDLQIIPRPKQCLKPTPVILPAIQTHESKSIRFPGHTYSKSRGLLLKSDFHLHVSILVNALFLISSGSANINHATSSSRPSRCNSCRSLVKSFEKGLAETSSGNHQGGDTSWEEKNLKSYANSEVRLVEIQERLCEEVEKGKHECLSLYEDSETEIENWWFKERHTNNDLDIYLCINYLKVCCNQNQFGPDCLDCPGCNKHGRCDGAGTRAGTGRCICDTGYVGDECEECQQDYFRIATSSHFTCEVCDPACNACYGLGPKNCTSCRSGYTQKESEGCIDINECEESGKNQVCPDMNSFCVNTQGSYRCESCHPSCAACEGHGYNKCYFCAPGFKFNSRFECIGSEESFSELDEDHDLITLIKCIKGMTLTLSVLWTIQNATVFRKMICTLIILFWWLHSELETNRFDEDPPLDDSLHDSPESSSS